MGYLTFVETQHPAKKTKTFEIANNLGTIKWYAPWRRYCFFPKPEVLFDAKCLQEIISFIDKQMEERKSTS